MPEMLEVQTYEILPFAAGKTMARRSRSQPCQANALFLTLRAVEGQGGQVLVLCLAGCDVANIVGALGLNIKDLFAHGLTKMGRKGKGMS